MNSLNNLSFTIIAAVGGLFALKGWISIGSIVVFAEYSRQFTRPLNDLANQFNTMLSAIAGAERVFDVLDEKEEREDEEHALYQPIKTGEIEFRDVSFGYQEDSLILKHLSFSVPKGQSIAFVGPTGAGKTTVTSLIARFYEPNNGKILIDGTDIKKLTRSSLRKTWGLSCRIPFSFRAPSGKIFATAGWMLLTKRWRKPQKPPMPTGSSNGSRKATIPFLPKTARASAKDKNSSFPSRELCWRTRCSLILDEATSNIDTVTEVKIQEALGRLMTGRTSVIIAHRLNTIQKADQILVLKDGEMEEKGTHAELLSQNGFYRELYESQFRES